MDRVDKEILDKMVIETNESLSGIESDILKLGDKGKNTTDTLNKLFRTMHGIKCSFSFLKLNNISKLAHSMEDILLKLKEGKLSVSEELVSALIDGSDKLQEMICNPQHSDTDPIERYIDIFSSLKEPKPSNSRTPDGADPKVIQNELSEKITSIHKRSKDREQKSRAIPTQQVLKKRVNMPEVLRVKVELLNTLMNLAGELVLARNQMINKMNQKPWLLLGEDRLIKGFESFMLRVAKSIEEAIISNTQFSALFPVLNNIIKDTIENEYKRIIADFKLMLSKPIGDIPSIKEVLHQIDLITSDLQERIMQTRLQRLESVFSKLPRIVRDTSHKLKKHVKLCVEGEGIEVDKSIAEALSDPLTHILRNSVDHGIECPQEREKANKPPVGMILVKAVNEGGLVTIEISDNGAGLDIKSIKRKAVEKGIISQEDADTLPPGQITELLFKPGFSTADTVTGVSGRGVGMDVVKTNIEKLGGSVEIYSSTGVGTTVKLKIPLTMAIIPSLLVASGQRRFALPQTALEDLVRIRSNDVSKSVELVGTSPVIRRRGRLLPLISLSDVLGLEKRYFDPITGEYKTDRRLGVLDRRKNKIKLQKNDADNFIERRKGQERRQSCHSALNIVVLKVGANNFGLIVDEILDNEEIVVKPLSGYLKDCKCYGGSTILADGKVAMILDPLGISEYARLNFSSQDKENRETLESQAVQVEGRMQEMLLFKNGASELFSINIEMISRIDKIDSKDIMHVGNDEFIHYNGRSLRILRINDYINVDHAQPSSSDELYILMPKYVPFPVGIIATEVVDVISEKVIIDRKKINGTVALGTAIINNKLIICIDIFTLMEEAEPKNFPDLERNKFKGARILIADSSDFYRAFISKFFEDIGSVVLTAADGREAWEILMSDNRFNLVLTDIKTPGLSGVELTRKINSSSLSLPIPVIVLYLTSSDMEKKSVIEAGACGFEHKIDKYALLKSAEYTLSKN